MNTRNRSLGVGYFLSFYTCSKYFDTGDCTSSSFDTFSSSSSTSSFKVFADSNAVIVGVGTYEFESRSAVVERMIFIGSGNLLLIENILFNGEDRHPSMIRPSIGTRGFHIVTLNMRLRCKFAAATRSFTNVPGPFF